jgi:hypothetical protein
MQDTGCDGKRQGRDEGNKIVNSQWSKENRKITKIMHCQISIGHYLLILTHYSLLIKIS